MRLPGRYRDYPSTMVSPYYCWFKDLGYDELDVITYADGERAIIQYLRSPIIPSFTKWNFVLTKIRNVDFSHAFVKRQCDDLDLQKRAVWARQEASEKKMLEDTLYEDRRSEDRCEQWFKGIRNNDALMQRVAKNGLRELQPMRILNQIPRYRLGKGYKET